jgi:hypothetical protein
MAPLGRIPSAHRALATLVAVAACGCASRPVRGAPAKDCETRFFADSTSWLSGGRGAGRYSEDAYGAGAISGNPALRPVDPWVGAVGLKFGVVDEYEFGVGVCVPSPGASGPTGVAAASLEIDRARQVAAGVWLKLDF